MINLSHDRISLVGRFAATPFINLSDQQIEATCVCDGAPTPVMVFLRQTHLRASS